MFTIWMETKTFQIKKLQLADADHCFFHVHHFKSQKKLFLNCEPAAGRWINCLGGEPYECLTSSHMVR